MNYPVQLAPYVGFLSLGSFLGGPQNLLLNVLGTVLSQTLSLPLGDTTANIGQEFDVGTTTYRMVGSGTAQPGINFFGIVIPTGVPVDLLLVQNVSNNSLSFVYPDGAPNLLSAIAMITTINAIGYDMATNAPVCFTAQTRLLTPTGYRSAGELVQGDVVLTHDGSARRILWTTQRSYRLAPDTADLLRPVMVLPRPWGQHGSHHFIGLSQQHRVLVPPDLLGTSGPVLIAAKALVRAGLARLDLNATDVTYVHLLCAPHAILVSEGIGVESMLAGPMAKRILGPVRWDQLRQSLGEFDLPTHPAAPIFPTGKAIRLIAQRGPVPHAA